MLLDGTTTVKLQSYCLQNDAFVYVMIAHCSCRQTC